MTVVETHSKKTLRRFGHLWQRPEGRSEGWITTTRGRFTVYIWPFNSIHQCKVFVAYPNARNEEGRLVGIGLDECETRDEAMQQGLAWTKLYHQKGPASAKQTIKRLFRAYKELYRTRADVLISLFLNGGGGNDWLDGSIISSERYCRPLRRPTSFLAKLKLKKLPERLLQKLPREDAKQIRSLHTSIKEARQSVPVGPLHDDGKPVIVHYVFEEYSNICFVPNDVRPDWLALAYEAAKLLRDRSTIRKEDKSSTLRHNRRIGQRVCKELERRFPRLRNQ